MSFKSNPAWQTGHFPSSPIWGLEYRDNSCVPAFGALSYLYSGTHCPIVTSFQIQLRTETSLHFSLACFFCFYIFPCSLKGQPIRSIFIFIFLTVENVCFSVSKSVFCWLWWHLTSSTLKPQYITLKKGPFWFLIICNFGESVWLFFLWFCLVFVLPSPSAAVLVNLSSIT